jgi:hypothetical protein
MHMDRRRGGRRCVLNLNEREGPSIDSFAAAAQQF